MKYLRILTSLSFFLAISLSGYSQGDCPYIDDEGEIEWVPCDRIPGGSTGNPVITESEDSNGGASGGVSPGGTPTVYCKTNYTIISEVTFPCGSGFGVAITWQLSCTSGNAGTCEVGTFTEYVGCYDGELPEEDAPNTTTISC